MIFISDNFGVDYSEYRYIKNNKKEEKDKNKGSKKSSKFKFFMCLLVLSLIIYIIIKIAGFTNVIGDVNVLNNTLVTKDYTFYCVNIKADKDINTYAKGISLKGGAGYVAKDSNEVVVAVYRDKQDADSVSKKLTREFALEVYVKEFKIGGKKIKFDTPNTLIEHNLKMIDNINKYFDEIYSLSINLDTKSVDRAFVKRHLEEDKGDFEKALIEYEEKANNKSSSKKITNAYNMLISNIHKIVLSSNEDSAFKGELKKFNVEIIYVLKSMIY